MSIRFADASEYTMPRRNSGIYNRSRTDHYDDSQIDVAWLNRQIMHVTRMVSALAVASIVIATAVAYSLFSSNSILAICIGLVAAYCLPLYGKQAFESFKVVLKSHSESICRATVVYDQLGAHLARICPVALRDQCISITPVGAEWPPELFVLLGAIAKRGGPSFIHSPSIYTK